MAATDTSSNFYATPTTPTLTGPTVPAGWAADPWLAFESMVPSPALPYLSETEESVLMASLGLPDPAALDRLLCAKAAPDHLAPSTHLQHVESMHRDPLSDFDFRAPPTGCAYDSVPVAPRHGGRISAATSSASETAAAAAVAVSTGPMAYDAMSDATLEDENLSNHAVPHSPDELDDDDNDDDSPYSLPGSGSSTPTRRRNAPFSKTKRRYPRSHTCREPERGEYASEVEFQSAWNTWRQIRDCNNEAVRRSRNTKKAMLSCKNESCTAMVKKLRAAEKIKELLLKAACTPHTLSRTENMAFSKLVASRAQFTALSAPADHAEDPHVDPDYSTHYC